MEAVEEIQQEGRGEDEEAQEEEVVAIMAIAAAIYVVFSAIGPRRGRQPPRLPWEQRLCYLDLTTR